ncbi:hypothetical protein FRC16_007048 [Serendipita sp. 398]|nr:hypothetical protein FRC16_007048 [Serendipita sp. 398]
MRADPDSSCRITVELPAQDDHFLQDIYHLVLELKLSDGSVDSADLLSRGSDTGIWDANDFLVLPEIGTHITLSESQLKYC